LRSDYWKSHSIAFSCKPTSAKTFDQSCIEFCRNSLAVGYHGLSLRSSSQRHSALYDNSTQSGLPMAPARWATLVQTEITKSRFSIRPAVSEKSSSLLPQGRISFVPERRSISPERTFFCRLIHSNRSSIKALIFENDMLRYLSSACSGFPLQTNPILGFLFCPSCAAHLSFERASLRKYGMFEGIESRVVPKARGRLSTENVVDSLKLRQQRN
jgi:hypothetical protein